MKGVVKCCVREEERKKDVVKRKKIEILFLNLFNR